MTTLKEKIEHKFEFDEQKLGPHLNKMKVPYDAISSYHVAEGARWQHNQLKSEVLPILLECVEALENAKMCLADRLSRNKAPEPYMIIEVNTVLERLRKWSEND